MKAYRVATGSTLETFGDPVREVPIRNVPLGEHQRIACDEAGLTLVDIQNEQAIPEHTPHIVFHDDLYLSWGMLRAFKEKACRHRHAPGILAIRRDDQTEAVAPLQDVKLTERHLLYPVRYVVPGSTGDPEPVEIDIQAGTRVRKRLPRHVLAEGETVHTVTSCSVVQIITPLHLHWANMLAILNHVARWKPTGLLGTLSKLLPKRSRGDAAERAPSPLFYKFLQQVNRIGKNCDIHPSAVVEGSVLGDNVHVGAQSYIQFSHIGDGAEIGNGACVFSSCIGAGSHLVTREWVSMCVVYPNVFFAPRYIQFAVVGRDAQVFPSMYYDYRLDGRPLQTPFRGKLVNSGSPFLGPVIGHRAKIAGGLILAPGRVIPNGVTVLPNEKTVVNRIPDGLREGQILRAGE